MAEFMGNIASKVLGMETGIYAVLPEDGDLSEAPVIYLLHGLSDNCSGWRRYTRVESYAREHGAVLVMPEVQRSFYTDTKMGLRYFTYVNEELPEKVGKLFRIGRSPDKTYVFGLSMGGYGAMKCAFSAPEKYAGCAAFSAVADLAEALREDRYDMRKNGEAGAYFGGEELEPKSDLFFLAERCHKAGAMPKIFLTCGKQDELFPMNEKLVSYLRDLGANPEVRFRDGIHNWAFWDVSVKEALDYFLGEGREC